MITCPQASSFYPSSLRDRVDDSVKWRVRMEKRIARSLIVELLEQGCSLSVYDGGETTLKDSVNRMDILYSLATTDEDYLFVKDSSGKKLGWYKFMYGETGYDVICDHSMTLENMYPKTADLIRKLEGKVPA